MQDLTRQSGGLMHWLPLRMYENYLLQPEAIAAVINSIDQAREFVAMGADGLVVNFKGSIFGMQAADLANATHFWIVAWSAAWIAGLIIWAARRSRLGVILRAVRENEERMRFSGFNTYAPRLTAFVLVNAIAGACGLLHVLNAGFVSPDSLGLSVSTNTLVAALIGGVDGSIGPIVGGLAFSFAQDQFGAYGATQLFTGLAIVVFIVLLPSGVVGGLLEALQPRARALARRRKDA